MRPMCQAMSSGVTSVCSSSSPGYGMKDTKSKFSPLASILARPWGVPAITVVWSPTLFTIGAEHHTTGTVFA